MEKAPDEFSAGCVTLKMEQAFLSKIDSGTVREKIERKLEERQALSDDELMQLIILPLTYKGKEKKREAVKEAVELAKRIADQEEKTFVLSGILVFADKIIDADTAEYIKELVRMTQVAELLLEEGREESRRQGIYVLVDTLRSLLIPDETIVEQLIERYQLTRDEANGFIEKKEV